VVVGVVFAASAISGAFCIHRFYCLQYWVVEQQSAVTSWVDEETSRQLFCDRTFFPLTEQILKPWTTQWSVEVFFDTSPE
jgi:hypothetical protein